MKEVFILSCSTDLGSCCTDKALSGFFSVTNNIISLIQLIVPIMLIVAVIMDMIKLMQDPDNKKIPISLRNKLIAALVVFMIPVLVNTALNLVSSSGQNSYQILSCLKESKNVKLSGNTTYIDPNGTEGKDNKRSTIPGANAYEKGKKKKSSSTGNGSSVIPGQSFTPTSCRVGDSNVKIVDNDSHRHAKIVRKANGQEVANYARSWLGKGLTYNFGSTGELRPGGTCDCSHFVYKVLEHFGIIEGGQIRTTVWGSCNVEGTTLYSDVSRLVPGDVIFKYFGGTTAHVELYIGNGESIGCNSGRGITHGHSASKYTSFVHLSAYD